ncbi:hypothetical protein HAALTHF_47350n [Vreelandella aquamarina]|nr:hypothetical protein HAALTHF_47350n [Halomonas axialensis]
MSSNAPRRPVRDLRFFLTVPHACSYLPGKEATTLFLDPQESPVPGVYDSLSLLGFRRSGRHLYRPSLRRLQCLPLSPHPGGRI